MRYGTPKSGHKASRQLSHQKKKWGGKNTCIASSLLTVSQIQAQTISKLQPHVEVSHEKNVAGIYQSRLNSEPKGVTLVASFFMHGNPSMVGRAGCPSGYAGSLFRSLVGPLGSPPVYYQRTVGDNTKPKTEDFHNGKSRHTYGRNLPKIYQLSRAHHWLSQVRRFCVVAAERHLKRWELGMNRLEEKALIMRIRRHLASQGLQLRITREGSFERAEHGALMVVEPRNGVILHRHITLQKLAETLGLIGGAA